MPPRAGNSFGQNALTHSMEVAWLSGLLASELGVNVTMARRAGLLHDIGKALDHEIEGSHVQIGVDICRKYKENAQVIHAVEAHHGDVEPKTPLAFIVQAADAISAARPGARRENVESYVRRLENLEEIASGFEGVEQAFAVQAGREVRIWRRLPPASRASSRPLPFRPAGKCGSWSSPMSSGTIRSFCWPGPLPGRSRRASTIPARSRSTSSGRAAPWNTPSNPGPQKQNNSRRLSDERRRLFCLAEGLHRGLIFPGT